MSTDRARINGQNVTCYFREKDVHDPQSAAGLIVRIAGMEGFEARYIALRDLDGDPGQDNKSRQFAPAFEIAVTVPRSRRELIGTLSRAVTQPFETAF